MKNTISRTPLQKIELKRFDQGGRIIDIGGGSEALVSRIEGRRVCAIDINMTRIREGRIYRTSGNWILADGRKLCFCDSSFSIATLWFSLAYMREERVKYEVLQETHRVLTDNGNLSIIGCKIDSKRPVFEFQGLFHLPDDRPSKIIYRVSGDQKQSLDSVSTLVEEIGFVVVSSKVHEYWFKLICRK